MKIQTPIIEVFIADDHELLRKGLISLLEDVEDMHLTGEAANGAELINKLQYCTPDIVMIDFQMPVMDGVEATRIITKTYPSIAVIAISSFKYEHNIIKMITSGARGFVSKGANKAEFLEAIRTVHKNRTYYDKPIGKKLLDMIAAGQFDPQQNKFTSQLTARETEVLRMICMQKTNREISSLLELSPRTIEDFRNNLLTKTESDNTAGLVLFAIRFGIYDPE